MFQLLCGCKGRCYLGPPPSVVAQTDTDSADGVAGKESDGEMVLDASGCLLYTSPSPRDKRQSRMPSSA